MTREDAVKNGFKYEGRMGVVPVYMKSPQMNNGEHSVGVRGNDVWEYVMDFQEFLVDAILFFNPKFALGVDYQRRIDGGEMPASEADL